MSKTYSYHPQLHLASINTNEPSHHMAVHVLQQHPGAKQPAISAYLGARYSRSSDSILKIAEEAYAGGVDAAKRLENIFSNYGHKSVGDMADQFLCIENIPMILGEKLFNQIPVLAGQERSTRYQDFSNPDFVNIPSEFQVSTEIKDKYEKIIQKGFNDYSEMLAMSKVSLARYFNLDLTDKNQVKVLEARSFDTAKFLLPMGTCTSLGILSSARVWSDTIAYLKASPSYYDREVAELILELLKGPKQLQDKGFIPEADGLVRHTEANPRAFNTAKKVMSLLTKWGIKKTKRKLVALQHKSFTVSESTSAMQSLIRSYLLLLDPLSKEEYVELTNKQWQELGSVIFTEHNHHNQIRNVAQQGAILIEGMSDLGILKDLNRHRSFERFVPLWSDIADIDSEFDRPNERMYFMCDYLELSGMESLKKEFVTRLNESYEMIKDWLKLTKDTTPSAFRSEFVKYLIPHAHATAYRFYASVDDLQYTINLRTRNGGHIAYRALTYAWAEDLAKQNPFWKGLLNKLPKVDAGSREQFIDRS